MHCDMQIRNHLDQFALTCNTNTQHNQTEKPAAPWYGSKLHIGPVILKYNRFRLLGLCYIITTSFSTILLTNGANLTKNMSSLAGVIKWLKFKWSHISVKWSQVESKVTWFVTQVSLVSKLCDSPLAQVKECPQKWGNKKSVCVHKYVCDCSSQCLLFKME